MLSHSSSKLTNFRIPAEFWLGSDPGVPLAEANRFPGMATPVDGKVIPSDAPGFGMAFTEENIVPW